MCQHLRERFVLQSKTVTCQSQTEAGVENGVLLLRQNSLQFLLLILQGLTVRPKNFAQFIDFFQLRAELDKRLWREFNGGRQLCFCSIRLNSPVLETSVVALACLPRDRPDLS